MPFSLPECTYCGDECRETHDVSLDGYCSAECKAAAEADDTRRGGRTEVEAVS